MVFAFTRLVKIIQPPTLNYYEKDGKFKKSVFKNGQIRDEYIYTHQQNRIVLNIVFIVVVDLNPYHLTRGIIFHNMCIFKKIQTIFLTL